MKKVLMMLCVLLSLASCKKEELQKPQTNEGQTLSLDVTATAQDPEAKNKSEARAVGFYINPMGKLRSTLKGLGYALVHTFIYNGDELVYHGALRWNVSDDGKTISYKEPITTTKPLDPLKETKLVAILSNVSHRLLYLRRDGKDMLNFGTSYLTQHAYHLKKGVGEDSNVNIPTPPYVLECALSVNASGDHATNKNLTEAEKRFKPKGYFVEFTLSNHSGGDMKIKSVHTLGIKSYYYIISEGKFSCVANNFTEDKNINAYSFPIENPGNHSLEAITVPNYGIYPEPVYIWLPTLDGVSFDFGYEEDKGVCPVYVQKGGDGSYEQGNLYKVSVDFRAFPNPLSFFSRGPVSSDKTQFLDNPGANNPSVGLFTYEEAKNLTLTQGTDKYKLPTQAQWNSILPSYHEVRVDNYSTFKDIPVIGTYRSTVRGEYDHVGGTAGTGLNYDTWNIETYAVKYISDNTRPDYVAVNHGVAFAFRYVTERNGEYTKIYCRRAPAEWGDNLNHFNMGDPDIVKVFRDRLGEGFWSDPNVVETRVFPSVDIYGDGRKNGGAIFWGMSDGTDPVFDFSINYIDLGRGDRAPYVPYGGKYYAWILNTYLKVSQKKHPSAERYPAFLYKQN